ncbi:helix-turn-helix domain-containing protein [Paenibacillus sp. FSL R10-2771]|uniref:helix-turn-helix domain-containing protein n=1 Tax=Paenibacillus sp. FSL R10-2771 TaxID=2954693 RepID=UPI0030FD1CDF
MGNNNEFSGIRAARINSGKSVDEVSILTDLTKEQIIEFERVPADVPASLALVFAEIYNTTVDHICFE